ncbi:MAG: AMP-binding protein, partial [Candidatus Binatia bacterium]
MFEGNGRTDPGGRAETIYQLLRAWAQDTPEAIALAAPGHAAITYERLLNQIDAVAKSLREVGIDHDHRIVMVLPNGIELAAMFLGVSCSAISVPLNPACQENEIESYLSGLGAKAVLVQSTARSPAVAVAQRHRIPVIELISTQSGGSSLLTLKASAAVSSARQHQLEPDDVALILHTSGTTSKPKRVPLTHRNLYASAHAVRDTLRLTSADRCLGVMPLFHIHGLVGGLLSSLAAGSSFAAIVNADPRYFFDSMKVFKPTWYTA